MTAPSGTNQSIVILTCMDSRIDPCRALGLDQGAAHVVRNAGALATEDALRSLAVAQSLLGISSVAIVAHTDCALSKVREGDLARRVERDAGEAPSFAFGAFADVDEHVRDQVRRVRTCPWLPNIDDVRGYVLDVHDNHLSPVSEAPRR